jgi:hypothetical protein
MDIQDQFWAIADLCDSADNLIETQCNETNPEKTRMLCQITPKVDKLISPLSEDLLILSREDLNDGVLCEVGSELWEASIILSCVLLLNINNFVNKRVLELGAGIGIPGLLVGVLKHLLMSNFCDLDSEGIVSLTDFDTDLLKNLCAVVKEQFSSMGYHVHESDGIHEGKLGHKSTPIEVRSLNWMDYTNLDQSSHDRKSHEVLQSDILIGSELVYMPALQGLADLLR